MYKVKYMHRSNANYKEAHCEKSFQKGMNLEDLTASRDTMKINYGLERTLN